MSLFPGDLNVLPGLVPDMIGGMESPPSRVSPARWRDDAREVVRDASLPLRLWDAFKARRLDTAQAKRVLTKIVLDGEQAVTAFTRALTVGKLRLASWFKAMRDALVPRHFAAAMVALNEPVLVPADEVNVSDAVDGQIRYLDRFRADIAGARQLLDGTVMSRAALYAHAAWSTGVNALLNRAVRNAHTEARRVLGEADHCDGCKREAKRNWVAIGNVAPIGSVECLTRCHCWIEVR